MTNHFIKLNFKQDENVISVILARTFRSAYITFI